jgi:mannose-binding lectin 1
LADGPLLVGYSDGSTQQIAGCLRDFRNKPFPVRARIQYYKNILSVMFNNGMSNNDNDYEMCLRVENVFLPARGHFGLSAATGGLADDHDVQKFMTWSITAQDSGFAQPNQIPNADQQKFEQEFQNYQTQLDEKKKE